MFSSPDSSERKPQIDDATRDEIRRLVAGFEQSEKLKFPRLKLMLKMGSGYIAMAVFTIAALTFSAFTLYGINSTARRIVYVDLPAMDALNKLRTSLLAQENFAGKYAILKDPTFIQLFHQREQETIANLTVLERTGLVQNVEVLKSQYRDYQGAATRLFSGKSGTAAELRPLAVKLLGSVDSLSEQRQVVLQGVLNRADYLRHATVKWTIILSCLGFLVAILAALLISYRIFTSLKRLQKTTHQLAAGDFHYQPVTEVSPELVELAGNFAKIADRLRTLEEMRTTQFPRKDDRGEETTREKEAGAANGATDAGIAKE